MDVVKFVNEELTKSANKQFREVDKFILRFFGSMEEVKKHAGDYVLEIMDVGLTQSESLNEITLYSEMAYRIRPKTPEEKLAESTQP